MPCSTHHLLCSLLSLLSFSKQQVVRWGPFPAGGGPRVPNPEANANLHFALFTS